RVLTPRDHFAHRGGGREKIMHNSRAVCNRKLCVFFRSVYLFGIQQSTIFVFKHSLSDERCNRFDTVKQDYYLIVLTTCVF
ncbi:MAG: hypothetical protein DME82_15660, partial [Verrucomicrobia bacterium]